MTVKGKSNFLILILLIFSAFQIHFGEAYAQLPDTIGLKTKLDSAYFYNKNLAPRYKPLTVELTKMVGSIPNTDSYVRVYTLAGRAHIFFGTLDSCLSYFKIAQKNVTNKTNPIVEGHLMQSFGNYYSEISNAPLAIKYNQKAYTLFQLGKDSLRAAGALGNIGSLYDDLEIYEKAHYYFNESNKIFNKYKDYRGLGINYNNVGNVYLRQNDVNSAIKNFELAIVNLQKAGLPEITQLAIKGNLAKAYLFAFKPQQALKLSLENLATAKKYGLNGDITYFYSILVECYTYFKKNELAIAYADTGFRKAVEIGDYRYQVVIGNMLKSLYTKVKDYEKAIEYAAIVDSLTVVYSDSAFRAELTKLESEFQAKRKDETINQLIELKNAQEKVAQNQQNIIYLTLVMLFIVAVGGILVYLNYKRAKRAEGVLGQRNEIIERQNVELRNQNEFQLMIMGIIGHDLKGPIGSMVSFGKYYEDLLENKEYDDAKKHAQLMFQSLGNMHQLADNLVQWALSAQSGLNINFKSNKILPLLEETTRLIQDALSAKKIEVIINSSNKEVSIVSDSNCLQTIFRNLLSNAIKFSNLNSKIYISIDDKPNEVSISIADEGIGMQEDVLSKLFTSEHRNLSLGTSGEKGSGFGLLMVQSLVRLNYGTIRAESQYGEGSIFILKFPKASE